LTVVGLFSIALLSFPGCSSQREIDGRGRTGPSGSSIENARFALSSAKVRAVIDQGITYLQWQFKFKAKIATAIQSVRVEDITGPIPIMLVNDQAVQLSAGEWSGFSGEIDPQSATISWLFGPGESVRSFRYVITGVNGESDTLQQTAAFSQGEKTTLRQQYGIR
jgi:hypothetical protein